jgi:hypothetical protein
MYLFTKERLLSCSHSKIVNALLILGLVSAVSNYLTSIKAAKAQKSTIAFPSEISPYQRRTFPNNNHHHQQPINVPTAGAQAFLMDYT